MEEQINDGEATKPIEQEGSPAFGPDDVKKMIAEAVGETNKNWQSRFDKILSEKKQTETKAMTVEEQIAQLKSERESERIGWVRKEARAKAGIDEGLEAAVLAYASKDTEAITGAADFIKSFLESRESEHNKQIEELTKRLQYGTKPPSGGGNGKPAMKMSDFRKLEGKAQAEYIKSGGALED